MSEAQAIVRLAARGDGVTADGRFVAGAAVGDHVTFTGGKPLIAPGPDHATPPCRHYPDCGGCQLQHITDAAYGDYVADRIRRPLAQLGLAAGWTAPVALSPPASRRRASLRAVRRGGRLSLGFNAEGSHRIVDITECPVLRPELVALIAPLRTLLSAAVADGEGAGVSLTLSDTGIDLLLANVAAERLDAIERLADFAATHDLARLSVENAAGVETLVEARAPRLTMGGASVILPPAPFLQATAEGEAALVAAARQALGAATQVADLFCGLGSFALPLAATARVTAADANGPALAALAEAARQARLLVTAAHRDLFRRPYAAAELGAFDAVLFDPPRAGAQAQTAELAKSKVPVVVAVSCNPGTFARDARTLADGGYTLTHLWPVAQFRWSTHVELAARFAR